MASTRRRTCCIQRPFGCCARRAPRTPISTWTVPRASLLSVLVFAGPQPVTRLAELEQVSAPAITKMVSALESTGLARRERSETDRRIVLVSATPAGKHLLERGRAARVRAIAVLLADATEAQLQTLRAASDVIADRL